MTRITLTLILIFLTLATAGCSKKPQKDGHDVPVESNYQKVPTNSDITAKDDLDVLSIKLCEEGNCPCGDGACSKGSYCIIDLCFCGAYPEQGYFDHEVIASNNYGEFECVTTDQGADSDGTIDYDFGIICNRDEGCKTAKGDEFPKAEDLPSSLYDPDAEVYVQNYDSDLYYHARERLNHYDYEGLIKENYLRNYCGKKLRDAISFHNNMAYSKIIDSKDLECEFRKVCGENGITQEHISEYVCDFGRKFTKHCDCKDNDCSCTYETQHQEIPIGVRCVQPEGCTCGNMHCPENSLCKDGVCMFDLYYQHRVCPGENWDPNELDSVNYMSNSKENFSCLDDMGEKLKDFREDDVGAYKEYISDVCYWKIYSSKVMNADPCTGKAQFKTNQTVQNSEFNDRKPFKYTITTNIDTDLEDVRILVDVESVDGSSPVKYDLDCNGDGEYEYIGLTKKQKCRYSSHTGDHQIWIRGSIPSVRLCQNGFSVDNDKSVVSVDSWGNIEWKSMSQFAAECKILKKLPDDAPNLSQVTDLTNMFKHAESFNQPLNHWDVSNVTDMSGMFEFADAFNQEIDGWNVSKVKNMSRMFASANSFNQPIERWDVSKVIDMSGMFTEAQEFNQPLDKWNVSHVTDMSGMFHDARLFNQSLEKWDVSSVTNMSSMFDGAWHFNQSLENWNVSNVMNMSSMFKFASDFNQPLNKWNVSKVKYMKDMFGFARKFNQPLEKWDVSNVTDMSGMFDGAKSFNQPLNKWNVSKVMDMAFMFGDAIAFNQPLDKWNVSNVVNMESMFRNAISFSYYPSYWVIPVADSEDSEDSDELYDKELDELYEMFFGTDLKDRLTETPLKTRKVRRSK